MDMRSLHADGVSLNPPTLSFVYNLDVAYFVWTADDRVYCIPIVYDLSDRWLAREQQSNVLTLFQCTQNEISELRRRPGFVVGCVR